MYKRSKSRLDQSVEALRENEFLFEEVGEEDGEEEEEDMTKSADAKLDLSKADSEAVQAALEALEAALGMPSDESSDDSDDESAEVDDSDDESAEGDDDLDALLGDEPSSDEPELEEESYMVDGDMLDGDIHDEGMDEAEMDEYHMEGDDEDDDDKKEGMHEGRDVYLDIDENMLRREISRMKNLREGRASRSENADAQKVSRTNRKLVAEVAQYKKALNGMKGQLQEMNLFNAKLLYANKLMQNRNLTLSQQKKIVESLDGAKSLREAKILFEGIVNALNKQNKASKNLTEGTTRRILGESSRSTRSAQPANNRVEVDRWAALAGLK